MSLSSAPILAASARAAGTTTSPAWEPSSGTMTTSNGWADSASEFTSSTIVVAPARGPVTMWTPPTRANVSAGGPTTISYTDRIVRWGRSGDAAGLESRWIDDHVATGSPRKHALALAAG